MSELTMFMAFLHDIKTAIHAEFPETKFELTPAAPGFEGGVIDVLYGDRWLVIEWGPPHGFGISTINGDECYGERHHEVWPTAEAVTARALELIRTGARTVSPVP